MKKEDQEITLLDSDVSSSKNYIKDNYKTTNVNILLNRVRLDKKRSLKKRIVFSIILAALVSSGLPTDRFLFEGFLPPKKGRKKRIEKLINIEGTVVIYENSNRLKRTVKQLHDILGDRPAVLCRELTKMYEEIVRGTLSSLLHILENKTFKGECVLLVSKDDKNIYFE